MSRKKTAAPVSPPEVPPNPPVLYEASTGAAEAVLRGRLIDFEEAVERRRAGLDVVVCGNNLSLNRAMASSIELAANGAYLRHTPHARAGPNALPHVQPVSRPPEGHTFYETPHRRAR